MLVAASNRQEISAAPRKVFERTRRMPGTSRIACSSGRVTVSIIERAGRMPLCATTTMRGNCRGG